MIRINIDGKEIVCPKGITILEAARDNDIDIPTLCHDSRVSSLGSCGLCAVEVDDSQRLLRSCSTIAEDGMLIRTNTERIMESRRTALELLLSDHVGDCRPPCVLACPAQTACQGYIGLIAAGEFKEASILIRDKIPLPASIGRVCPHPCETACRRELVEEPISIAKLKYFAADYDLNSDDTYMPPIKEQTDKSIAIIGGGPGGLSAAYFLRELGHEVTVYDSMPKMGGMLRYGIPEYRLPKKILDKEINLIKKMGVSFINNINIGCDISFDQIKEQFDAVIIAIGAWKNMKLNCLGEELDGVIGGIDFLQKVALKEYLSIKDRRVAVVGGGNVAMDACRTAVRLGAAEVYNIYRRTRDEMPAEDIEIHEAEEEGVIFKFLTNPIEIMGVDDFSEVDDFDHNDEESNKDNTIRTKVSGVRLQKMELGEPDDSGRRRPIPIVDSVETLDIDVLIVAIGQKTVIDGFEQLPLTKYNTFAVDTETFSTGIDGVFAIGDAVNKGADIAISAIAHAKGCASVVDGYLSGTTVKHMKPFVVERRNLNAEDFSDYEKVSRIKPVHRQPEIRRNDFTEVVSTFSPSMAQQEAARCLKCGCSDYFECKLIGYANSYNASPYRFSGDVREASIRSEHPYIEHNPNKCILCGLCVRVCDEVMGISALGYVNRGFDTTVEPALCLPLGKTNCIDCGQCVALCPTGALAEKNHANKLLTLDEDVTNTTCSMCSIGCNVNITSKGRTLLRCLPGSDKDLLCVKGRFEFNNIENMQRITVPLIKKEGKLEEVSLEEALDYISEAVDRLTLRYGASSVGVSLSDKLTNEEISSIKQYAEDVIGTDSIFSFSRHRNELTNIFGIDGSTTSFEEMENTDVIILVDSDIYSDRTIAGVKIKKAVENGAKLIVINDKESVIDSWATIKIITDNTADVLNQFMREISRLESSSDMFSVPLDAPDDDIIKKAVKMYFNARNGVVVFDELTAKHKVPYFVSVIAGLSRHIGRPRNGIIVLKESCNSQGLAEAKVLRYTDSFSGIKGLLVFGEEIRDIDVSGLEFVFVMNPYVNDSSRTADVVIGSLPYTEKSGTYYSTDRKLLDVNAVIKPLISYNTFDVINELSARR